MGEVEVQYFDGLKDVVPKVALQVLSLNEILAEVVFHDGRSGEPAHFDLDDKVKSALESRIGLEPNEFDSHIARLVCGVAKDKSPESVFRLFSQATKRWNNRGNLDPSRLLEVPPALALLALLTLAAERMRSGSGEEGRDEGLTAAAYYRRLEEVVDLPSWSTSDVQRAYRDRDMRFAIDGREIPRAIGLWTSLCDWLTAWETERGICTVAFPGTAKHGRWAIEMAISQALLREADRENLREMFELRNLDPVVPVSDEMLQVLLDEWSVLRGTPHLRSLWKDARLRESLIAAARNTLLTWSGSRAGGATAPPALGVALSVDLNPFAKRVDVGIEIRTGARECPEWVEILGHDGERVRTRLLPGGPRAYKVQDYGAFETNSLLSGIITVDAPGTELRGKRFPRPVVAFLATNSGNSYVEASSITLTSRHGILVRTHTSAGHNLLSDVEALLQRAARPGWSRIDSTKFGGLPEGWVFIQNVELIGVPEDVDPQSHLGALIPVPVGSMSLQGGFRIPGRRDRWLSDAAPEVVVCFPYASSQTLSIQDSMGTLVYSRQYESPVVVESLAQLGLESGTYSLEAEPNIGIRIRKQFFLVTADTPNPIAFTQQKLLGHYISNDHPFWVVSASRVVTSETHGIVRGLHIEGSIKDDRGDDSGATLEVPSSRQWKTVVGESSREVDERVQIELAPTDSCLYAKDHYWLLPMGQKKFRSGRCKFCQVVKQEQPRRKVSGSSSPSSKNIVSLSIEQISAIPPVTQEVGNRWDRVFDAMCYLRSGTTHELGQLVSQLGGGNLGVDRIVRSLSVLGHIDVELDERCRPRTWAVSPAVVVTTNSNRAHLAGFRSRQLLDRVTSRISDCGGRVVRIQNEEAPQAIVLEIPEGQSFVTLLRGVTDPSTKDEIKVQNEPAKVLLAAMPVLSEIVENAPKIGRPGFRKLNKWDVIGARWEAVSSDLPAGAYQSIGTGYVYTFHSDDIDMFHEVSTGTAALVKHRESLRCGSPLFFYDAQSKSLCCRLGAELPGLVARAVVALSGRIPAEDLGNQIVMYHEVDQATSEAVFRILRG